MRGLLAGICAALVLGGCGGGGSSTVSAPAGAAQGTAASVPQHSLQSTTGQQGKAKQTEGTKAKSKAASSSPHATKLVRVPPISSAAVAGSKAPAPGVKTVKGADDSVQTYGVEADEEARTQAAIALQAYLNDRLREDWASACSALAQRPKEQLEKLTQGQGEGSGGCAGAMEALSKGTPQAQLQEAARISEVLSFRGEGEVPGNPSYLIFTGPPGKTLYSMPMYLEAGGWKVGLAQASELPL